MAHTEHTYTNRLIQASSPYLLQHAHNPVNWYEWGEEAWEKARAENKLVLVSIGYSACHWCHVMERETFENVDTAAIMNEFFVCIKVDREERPDVDQVYMDAVQLITQQGGWPLNMFCLPDGKPLHGGTYFPNREWNQLLLQLENFYRERSVEAIEFAEKLTNGVRNMDIVNIQPVDVAFTPDDFKAIYEAWAPQFDWKEGGNNRAPKFPMPNNFQFLLNYYLLEGEDRLLEFVNLTLTKMAQGGIYDHLGGGFARYSVDGVWLVPHFEKMLYDNGQLVSLYANAYRATRNEFYRRVIEETLEFVKREMTNPSGGFYSALDADSEGVEGKFYVWRKEETDILLADNAPLFSEYYQVNEKGNWEHGNNILHTKQSINEFAAQKGITIDKVQAVINEGKAKLMQARDKRVRPGLDDKIICCWNALMLKGYADAWLATKNPEYLEAALTSKEFIEANFLQNNRLLRIHKDGKNTINAFLEDYACLVDAYIQLYQCTFDETLLETADKLVITCLAEFYDKEISMFYFTSSADSPLITRKTDIGDDVISSANSVMAGNLLKMAYYMSNTVYKEIAQGMLAKVGQHVRKYPSWYSHWADVALLQAYGLYQVVIIGPQAKEVYSHFAAHYLPNAIFAVAEDGEGSLPLFKSRYVKGKTLIYVCKNETCHLPVENVESAVDLMR